MKAQALQIREIIKWDNWSEGNWWNPGSGQGDDKSGYAWSDHNGHGGQPHPSHPGDNEEREGAGSSRQGDGNRDRQNPEQNYVSRTRSGHEPHRDAHGDQNEPKNNN